MIHWLRFTPIHKVFAECIRPPRTIEEYCDKIVFWIFFVTPRLSSRGDVCHKETTNQGCPYFTISCVLLCCYLSSCQDFYTFYDGFPTSRSFSHSYIIRLKIPPRSGSATILPSQISAEYLGS